MCTRPAGTLPPRFVTVSPQTASGWGGGTARKVHKLLDELIDRRGLGIDARRIYLTGQSPAPAPRARSFQPHVARSGARMRAGVSMGGGGVWAVSSMDPRRFAAIAPVCGSGIDTETARALAHTPTWVWHGANDAVMPVELSDSSVEALKNAGAKGDALRYTRVESAPAPVGWPHYTGHASWIPAYDPKSSGLWEWFLLHTAHPHGKKG